MRILLIAPERTLFFAPPAIQHLSDVCSSAMNLNTRRVFASFGFHRPSVYTGHAVSRGLLFLAAMCEKQGHQVCYLQMDYLKSRFGESAALQKLQHEAATADVVGITAKTPTIQIALRYALLAKTANPEIVTVLGGPHASYSDYELLGHEQVDYVIRGEGLEAFKLLINSLGHSNKIPSVPNLTYRFEGKLVRNTSVAKDNLSDPLLPAYHLLPQDEAHEFSIVIETSRGCPFKCAFCAEAIHGIRYRNPIEVADEINLVSSMFNQDVIFIGDSILPTRCDHLNGLASALSRFNDRIALSCNVRAELAHTPDILQTLRKIGVINIFLGIESGSQDVLNAMNKRASPDRYHDFLRKCRSVFPIISTSWLIGHPGESEQSIMETHSFFKILLAENLLNEAWPKLFVPYPGIPLVRAGTVPVLSNKWENYGSVVIPPLFDPTPLSYADLLRCLCNFYFELIDHFGYVSQIEKIKLHDKLDQFFFNTSI